MSKHIKNEACPKCRADGHDKSGDNLSRYSDGSAWCFKCHYYILADNVIEQYKQRRTDNHIVAELPKLLLPKDSVPEYPDKALKWVAQYGLTKNDLMRQGVLFSETGTSIKKIAARELLIFPLWAKGVLLGWQGRYFGETPGIPKWVGKGSLKSVCHIISGKGNKLYLCEDIVSAIKLSIAGVNAMPLFGVDIKNRMHQFRVLNYLEYVIFLDPDMHKHSVLEANTMRLNGFRTHVILSEHDPKKYTYEELRNIV